MELRRASSVDEIASNTLLLAGGTELVPLLRAGLVAGDTLARRARHRATRHRRRARSAPARRWPSSNATRRSPPCCVRRAASRRARSSATWARSRATCCSRPAAGTGGSTGPCRLHGGDECFAHKGEHARACDLRERLLRLGPSVRPRGGAARARRHACARTGASFRSPRSTDCRPTTTVGRRRSSPAS